MEVGDEHEVYDFVDVLSLFEVIEIGKTLHIGVDHVHTHVKHDFLVSQANDHAGTSDILACTEWLHLDNLFGGAVVHPNIIT